MMTRKFKIILILILIFGMIGLWATHRGYESVENLTLSKYGGYLRKEFPTVEHIPTSALFNLLKTRETGGDPLVLIDCRTPEEYRISHIEGAENLQTADEVITFLSAQKAAPGTNLVVYCSVGYRSGKLAEALQEKGLHHIKNVIGSIFSWANEDRPLVDAAGNPTEKVHPYNQFWSRHLAEGKAAKIDE